MPSTFMGWETYTCFPEVRGFFLPCTWKSMQRRIMNFTSSCNSGQYTVRWGRWRVAVRSWCPSWRRTRVSARTAISNNYSTTLHDETIENDGFILKDQYGLRLAGKSSMLSGYPLMIRSQSCDNLGSDLILFWSPTRCEIAKLLVTATTWVTQTVKVKVDLKTNCPMCPKLNMSYCYSYKPLSKVDWASSQAYVQFRIWRKEVERIINGPMHAEDDTGNLSTVFIWVVAHVARLVGVRQRTQNDHILR